MSSDDDDSMVVSKIVITRRLSKDDTEGDVIYARTWPRDLALIESIGMIRLAEGILIEQAWSEDEA